MVSCKYFFIVIGILISGVNGFPQVEVPKCGADKIKIDLQRKEMQNSNIRQQIKYESIPRGEIMTMEKKRTEVITYDKQGRITEWAYYKNNTRVEAIYRYSYDSRGNLSELTLFSDIGDVLEKTIYSYNNLGYLSQETFFEAGNTFVSRSTFETDLTAKMIAETEYSANNAPVSKRIYYYSELGNGNVLKREVYKQSNNLYYAVELTYNINGDIDQEDFFSSSGNLAYQFIYKYDTNRNNTEKIKYSPTRSVLQRITTVFNSAGLERGVTEYDRQGRIVSSVQYEYVSF